MEQTIPTGWQKKTLGQICDILDSRRKPITQKNRVSGEYPYYGATGVLDHVNGWLFDEELILLGEDGAKWGSGEESAYRIAGKTWVNNHAHVIRPKRDEILDAYLVYFLNFQNLKPFITGTTVPKLNQEKMRQIPVHYPSLAEQERIVKKLDVAIYKIDCMKANAEFALSATKDLFESYANKSLLESSNFNIHTTFGKEFKIRSGDFLSAKNMDKDGKYNVYGGNGINGSYNQYNCSGENIIIGRVGEKCGNIHYVNECVWVTDNAFVLTSTEHSFDKKFLYYLLTKLNLRKYAAKSTHPVISGKSLKDVLVCFPDDIVEQEKIVEKLNKLQERTQKLEQIYTQKIKLLDDLKQSILKQAFAGEL